MQAMFGTRLAAGLALFAAACVVDRHADPAPVSEPRTCNAADITLDGSLNAPATSVGPLALDASGVTICLHLDATKNLAAAHFVAASDQTAGDSSGLAVVLQDPDRGTLQDGWDVTVDDTPDRAFANLEWNAPVSELTEAVLWVRAAKAPRTATVQLSLFEPAD